MTKKSTSEFRQNLARALLKDDINEILSLFPGSFNPKDRDARFLIKSRIMECFRTGDDKEKTDLLKSIEREASNVLALSQVGRFHSFKAALPWGKASRSADIFWELTFLIKNNPYVNKKYEFYNATLTFEKGLIFFTVFSVLLMSVIFLIDVFLKIPSMRNFTSAVPSDTWILGVLAGSLGACFSEGRILLGAESSDQNEFTVRARMVLGVLSASVASSVFLIFVNCFQDFSTVFSFIKKEDMQILEVCICSLIGAGDMILFDIMQKILRLGK